MAEYPDEQPAELVPDAVAGARSAEDLALLLRMLRRREARRRGGAPLTYRQLAARARCSHSVIAAHFTGKILLPTGHLGHAYRRGRHRPGPEDRQLPCPA